MPATSPRANADQYTTPTGVLPDRGRLPALGRQGASAPADPPELVLNGTFDTDVAEWTAANSATLTWVEGRCRISHTTVSNPYARQPVMLEIGKTYRFKAQTFAGGLSNVVRLGTSPGSGTILNSQTSTDQDIDFVFTAEAELHYISILNFTAVGAGSIDIDNISIKEDA